MLIKVQDGTNAGTRRSLEPPFPRDWKCLNCGAYNKKNWGNCRSCIAPRPKFH